MEHMGHESKWDYLGEPDQRWEVNEGAEKEKSMKQCREMLP